MILNLRKLLAPIASTIALCAFLPLSVMAADQNQLSFKANSDGTLTITDCDENAAGELVIPEKIGGRTVTTIGEQAFINCGHLTKVTLPSTVKTIEEDAFGYCYALEEINIPDGVTGLGSGTFVQSGLRSIYIPDSVKTIGSSCFSGCPNLASVRLPKGLKKIDSYTFEQCPALTTVAIPSGVTEIGYKAFYESGLVSITVPSGVKELPSLCFSNNENLTTVTLNEGLQSITNQGFTGCHSLKSIVIPDSVTSITTNAFNDCTSLNTVMLGKGLTKLGGGGFTVFGNCPSLQYVYLHSNLRTICWGSFMDCPAITDIYYCGNENQWLSTSIEAYNDGLLVANVHYIDSFNDVKTGSWYGPAVLWAVGHGITKGTGNNAFAPSQPCTRGQALTFMWRSVGSPAPSSQTTKFTDLKKGAYYYNAVLWAVENGITSGTSDTTFSPDATCTRAQIVTFLYRFMGSEPQNQTMPFTDVSADAYYGKPVLWAVQNGITSGTAPDKFSPGSECTRAQIVTFLYRAQ